MEIYTSCKQRTENVENVLQGRLKLHGYKIQMLETLQPENGSHWKEHVVGMLDCTGDKSSFLDRVIFSDK
jgi:hypothetical protein